MELAPLLTIHIQAEPPFSMGSTPRGEVRVIRFRGGTFEGDGGVEGGVRGTVANGGVDWQHVRADGVLEIRAHYLLVTDQEETVEVVSEGIRHAPVGVLDRIAAGEYIPADQYYFRTAIRLTTSSARLDHFNRLIAVSSGERTRDSVRIMVHAVR